MTFISRRPKLKLISEEQDYLKKVSRSRTLPARSVERAKMILSYFNEDTISEIARKLHTNRQKVERTIDKALALGAKTALSDRPRNGRKKVITSEARAWIISMACTKPYDHGYSYEVWTNRYLRDHIRNFGPSNGYPEVAKISGGTISKILNTSNIKPHKIESYVQKRDPDFDTKMIHILHTYKEISILRENGISGDECLRAYISFDEKPGIQAIGNTSLDLHPKPGKYSTFRRDYEYKRHGTLSLLAGIDLLDGTVHAQVFEKHRSEEFIEFLKLLDQHYPPEYKITVLLDNLKVHSSKETMKYLLTKPNRFSFVFTPTHASWLNIIECFFSKMTRSFLRGMRVESKNELKKRILQYICEVNQMPVVFKWKYKMDEIPGGMDSVLS
jgi:transposase